MTINNLKDLEAVIALCRKRGVLTIKVDNVELKLADEAPKRARKGVVSDADAKTEDAYSDEDVLMWSSAGVVNG